MVCTWVVFSAKGGGEENSWGKSSSCDLISPIQFLQQFYCHNCISLWSVLLETKLMGGKCLLIRHSLYRRRGKKRHKISYALLTASGIFLKAEIKSMTKNVWNQGFADLQTLPVSTARLGGSGHSVWAQGHSGRQPCQKGGALGQPCCLRRTLQAKTLIGFLRNAQSNQGEACKELTLSHCRCHVCLLAALTQVPNEAEERIRSISSPQFLRYSSSSFTMKAWPCPTFQNAI